MKRTLVGIIAGLACVTVLSGPLAAADDNGRYAVEGPGRMVCGDFVAATPGGDEVRDVAVWMSGYVSAHNRLMGQTFDLTPWQAPNTVLALLAQYCRANPDVIVERGAQELVGYLAAERLKEEDQAIAQRSGARMAVIYANVIERAMKKLADQGITAGPGDEGIAEAVRQYQKQEGLEETGLLDQPTLARIFR